MAVWMARKTYKMDSTVDEVTIAIAHIDDPVADEADALHKITEIAREHGHNIRDGYFDTAQDLYTIELPLGEGIFAGRFLDLTD